MCMSVRIGVMLMILGLAMLTSADLAELSAHTEDAEIQRRIDEVKRDLNEEMDEEFTKISDELKWRDTSLTWRGRSIDRWLVVLGIVITVFAVVIAVLAAFGFYEFRKLRDRAEEITDDIKNAKDTAEDAAESAQDAAEKADAAARRVSLEKKGSDLNLSRRSPTEEKESSPVHKATPELAAGEEAQMTGSHEADSSYEEAVAKLMHQDYQGAIAGFNQVIALNPDYAGAYNGRGFARKMLGQYHTAREDFDAAVRRNPHYVRAYINRGLAHAALGDTEAAKADWNTALDLAEQQGLIEFKRFIEGLLRDI